MPCRIQVVNGIDQSLVLRNTIFLCLYHLEAAIAYFINHYGITSLRHIQYAADTGFGVNEIPGAALLPHFWGTSNLVDTTSYNPFTGYPVIITNVCLDRIPRIAIFTHLPTQILDPLKVTFLIIPGINIVRRIHLNAS